MNANQGHWNDQGEGGGWCYRGPSSHEGYRDRGEDPEITRAYQTEADEPTQDYRKGKSMREKKVEREGYWQNDGDRRI